VTAKKRIKDPENRNTTTPTAKRNTFKTGLRTSLIKGLAPKQEKGAVAWSIAGYKNLPGYKNPGSETFLRFGKEGGKTTLVSN